MDVHNKGRCPVVKRLISLVWAFSVFVSFSSVASEPVHFSVIVEQSPNSAEQWDLESIAWLTRLAPTNAQLTAYHVANGITRFSISALANNIATNALPPGETVPGATIPNLIERIANSSENDRHLVVLLSSAHDSALAKPGMPIERPAYIRTMQGRNIPLYSISINGYSAELNALAALTNGTHVGATNRKSAEIEFARLLQTLLPRNSVPTIDALYRADRSVKNLTLLIFRNDPNLPAEFMSPALTSFSQYNRPDDVTWFPSKYFEIVHFANPTVGTWHVQSTDDVNNRVFVETTLTVAATLPTPQMLTRQELPVRVHLAKEDLPVVDHAILDNLVVKATHLINGQVKRTWFPEDSGADFDAVADDGIYTLALTGLTEPGNHELIIDAVTLDAQRRAHYYVEVIDRPMFVHRQEQPKGEDFFVYGRHQLIKPETAVLSIASTNPSDDSNIADLKHPDPYIWHGSLTSGQVKHAEINISVTDVHSKTVSIWIALGQLTGVKANPIDVKPIDTTSMVERAPTSEHGDDTHNTKHGDSTPAPHDGEHGTHSTDATMAHPTKASGTQSEIEKSIPWWRTTGEMLFANIFFAAAAFFAFRTLRRRQQQWLRQLERDIAHDQT